MYLKMWENFFVSLGILVKYFFDIYGYVFGAIFLEVFIAGAASQHTSRFIETGRNGCFKVNFINDSDLLIEQLYRIVFHHVLACRCRFGANGDNKECDKHKDYRSYMWHAMYY